MIESKNLKRFAKKIRKAMPTAKQFAKKTPLYFKLKNSINTGEVTLNGAKVRPITRLDGSPLTVGEIETDKVVTIDWAQSGVDLVKGEDYSIMVVKCKCGEITGVPVPKTQSQIKEVLDTLDTDVLIPWGIPGGIVQQIVKEKIEQWKEDQLKKLQDGK